jgi:CheY-like chemotaxis protein
MPDSPKRIMIADSEVNLARTLRADLEKRGYQVTLCHDGLECVANLREAPSDLLIVDTQLPVLDGLQVVGVAKEIHPELPVIVMSAYDIPGLKREAADAGAYACLIKPFQPSHLAGLAEQALSHTAPGTPATKRQPLLSLARLEPGQSLVLELRTGEYTGRYESRLLARHAATIVVACPEIGGVAFSPAFGSRVAVGFALADGWYRFDTSVIGSTHEDGEPALLLAQPRLVTHLQRRRFPRFATSLPARWMLTDAQEATETVTQVLDVSRGGLRITTSQAPSPGTRLTLTAPTSEPPGEIGIHAQAVWTQRVAGEEPRYQVGLRFVDVSGRAAAGLDQWLDELERQNAPAPRHTPRTWMPVLT